jgi:predicted nucleic acid-binding protein
MPDKVFVDTNILVYLANEDSPFHLRTVEKFKEVAGKSELWISRQVLREYAVVMTKPGIVEKPLSSKEITSDIEKWESIFQIADETEEVTGILVELIKAYDIKGKKIHDANIVAAMMANSIQTLFTLNVDDFKKFKKIQLIAI